MILTERKRRPSTRSTGFGRLVHPTSTAGTGSPRRTEVNTFNVGEVFYRCKQCGFHCLELRVQSPGEMGGEGMGGVTIGTNHEPNVSSGFCPLCGTVNSKAA
jgi:rubrerythrin